VTPPDAPAARAPAVRFILVAVLLDVIGIGVMLPVMPALVGEFTQDRAAQAHWYGLLTVTFGAMQFLCAPLLGALSDRVGRRPVLLLSITGLGLMFLVTAWAPSLAVLVASRVLGGALSASMSVAQAYVADITAPADRARYFGLVGAAFGMGFVIGPVIGGLLGAHDVRWPFYLAAALAFVNAAYGLLVLPESLPRDRRTPIRWRKANPFGALVGLTRLARVGPLVGVGALANLAQFVLHTVWVLYTSFRFGWGPRESGLSLFVVGVMVAIVQGALLSPLLRRFGERGVVLAGLSSATLAFVSYGLATAGWVMYATLVFNVLSFAVGAAINAMVSRAAPPNEQGLAMGAVSSVNSLMSVLAPTLGAPLLGAVSHFPVDDWRMGAPFFLAAGLNTVALAIAAVWFRRRPAHAATAAV
jgi:DHA1 family tetracycline resistance protein-like MFS transporter